MDLRDHTLRALDWPVVTAALSLHARTTRGRMAASGVPIREDLDSIRCGFRQVEDIWRVEAEGERLPLGGITDLSDEIEIARAGRVLEPTELQAIRDCMLAMAHLEDWIVERQEDAPSLFDLIEPLDVDRGLMHALVRAFDDQGELCGRAWPELGRLREQLRRVTRSVRLELDRILRSTEMEDILRDHYITEREGRLVIPIRASAPRRGLGIVHGTSQSGETLFLEPASVVARANEVRETEAAIRREVRRILTTLSIDVGGQAHALRQALDVVTAVDLASARASLGRSWQGTIPECGSGAECWLSDARHPVLVLRGIEVVPNTVGFGPEQRALILSGPNTGGKTVVLKTVGLCALLVRASVPIPVAEGSRMDLMLPVIADIGDIQTVEEDLSTFSGHLLILERILERIGPSSLVLLDEVGMGTDPQQGAALARAFLEAIVAKGARVVLTTHYASLRALATVDERFGIAAVEVRDGRPTYRLIDGQAGTSHAFTIARSLDVPEAIVTRAESLMDQGSRQVAELVEELESIRGESEAAHRELRRMQKNLVEQKAELTRKTALVEEERRNLARDMAREFGDRLKGLEDELKGMISALQDDPDIRSAGELLRNLRERRQQILTEVEPPSDIDLSDVLPDGLQPGDVVRVRSLGKEAVVVEVGSRGRVEVKLGGVTMKLKRVDLAGVDTTRREPSKRSKSSAPVVFRQREATVMEAVRTDGNTIDLRGFRLEEAIAETERSCDRLLLQGHDQVFVLHGHGTGVLKEGIREWARTALYIRRSRPGEEEEGGDAFTVLYLDS